MQNSKPGGNPFFNFLKLFRRHRRDWPDVKLAVEAARRWREMPQAERRRFGMCKGSQLPKIKEAQPRSKVWCPFNEDERPYQGNRTPLCGKKVKKGKGKNKKKKGKGKVKIAKSKGKKSKSKAKQKDPDDFAGSNDSSFSETEDVNENQGVPLNFEGLRGRICKNKKKHKKKKKKTPKGLCIRTKCNTCCNQGINNGNNGKNGKNGNKKKNSKDYDDDDDEENDEEDEDEDSEENSEEEADKSENDDDDDDADDDTNEEVDDEIKPAFSLIKATPTWNAMICDSMNERGERRPNLAIGRVRTVCPNNMDFKSNLNLTRKRKRPSSVSSNSSCNTEGATAKSSISMCSTLARSRAARVRNKVRKMTNADSLDTSTNDDDIFTNPNKNQSPSMGI